MPERETRRKRIPSATSPATATALAMAPAMVMVSGLNREDEKPSSAPMSSGQEAPGAGRATP